MTETAWVRSWAFKTRKTKRKRVHIEVRDPKLGLSVVKTYTGKDHTFHIILEEGKTNGTKTRS